MTHISNIIVEEATLEDLLNGKTTVEQLVDAEAARLLGELQSSQIMQGSDESKLMKELISALGAFRG